MGKLYRGKKGVSRKKKGSRKLLFRKEEETSRSGTGEKKELAAVGDQRAKEGDTWIEKGKGER